MWPPQQLEKLIEPGDVIPCPYCGRPARLLDQFSHDVCGDRMLRTILACGNCQRKWLVDQNPAEVPRPDRPVEVSLP